MPNMFPPFSSYYFPFGPIGVGGHKKTVKDLIAVEFNMPLYSVLCLGFLLLLNDMAVLTQLQTSFVLCTS